MLFRSLGLSASVLALAANAIMIPPEVGIEGLSDDNSIETLGADAFKSTVTLDCATCPLALEEGKTLVWKDNAGNSFNLEFTVGQSQDTLEISGVQLYPPSFGHLNNPFYVTQADDKALRLRVTGYTFHYSNAETISEAGTELLPLTFRITAVETKSVSLPALTIYLLKDASGRLMIANVQTVKAAESSPKEEIKECNDWPLLCKWKSIFADKMEGIKSSFSKGCHKHKSNPMERPGIEGKPPHRFRPGRPHPHHRPHPEQEGRPHRHGHHGHHRHHHSKFQVFLRRAVLTVLVPIFIGIFAGTLTYLLGMAIGCGIAMLVAKVRGRPQYQSVALDEEEGDDDDDDDVDGKSDEKEVYSDLPEYEAPPVYEEAAEKEVVAESH